MKLRLDLHTRYRIIAFVSGFVLMAYELAGSRILSPVVGSSTYVWTSIIGVIIAALSAGYFIGGRLADKRKSQVDLSLLLVSSAVGILSTLLLSETVLYLLTQANLDVRIQALLASLILFAPASVMLGALSPYLARLHTASINETGRSIAALSALNSLGGIVGTFSVGFIFFGFIGSRETLVVLIFLQIISGFLLVTKKFFKLHIRSLIIIGGLAWLALLTTGTEATVVARIETPTSAYQVRDITYNEQAVRVLTMGPGGYQSGVYLDGRKELVFGYTQAMARGVKLHPQPQRVLILGGGSFTMPEYFATAYPKSQIDVVEIDPKLQDIAREYFSYSDPKNVKIFNEDARTFVNNVQEKYDIILIDAYSDTGIPFVVTTEEFSQKLSEHLKPGGGVMMNVIAGDNAPCRPLLRSIYAALATQMIGTVTPVSGNDLDRRQNLILAFTKDDTKWLQSVGGKFLEKESAIRLTDNFAPIERLHQNCLNR